jgi:hypothetical protein
MDDNDPSGFKATRKRTDLSQGVSLRDAILYYGDLESPEELYSAHVLTSSPGILESVRCALDPDALLSKYNQEAFNARSAVVTKLSSGELLGTGIRSGAPLAAGPENLHPDLWRILVPDFNASSARLPTGELILGIRVFPGPFWGDAAAVPPLPLKQETFRTGFAGRPPTIARPLIEAEMQRRAKSGELKSSMREEAEALVGWYVRTYPEGPPVAPGTIRNILGALYRRLVREETEQHDVGGTKSGTKLF